MQKSDDEHKNQEGLKTIQTITPFFNKAEESTSVIGVKKWMEVRQEWLKVHCASKNNMTKYLNQPLPCTNKRTLKNVTDEEK